METYFAGQPKGILIGITPISARYKKGVMPFGKMPRLERE
jgi:hypothetical protein